MTDVTITNGSPVKARRYYRTGTSKFEKHRRDEPLYVIGKNTSKGIQHTSDVRDVQAYSSTVNFIYGNEETEWETLEAVVEELGRSADSFQRIYRYDGGERIKALKSNPETALTDLSVYVSKAESQDIAVNSLGHDEIKTVYVNAEDVMDDFNRNPDRESDDKPFVWEHKSEDIDIVIEREEGYFKALELVGGYVEHEIVELEESLEKTKNRSEAYMSEGEVKV